MLQISTVYSHRLSKNKVGGSTTGRKRCETIQHWKEMKLMTHKTSCFLFQLQAAPVISHNEKEGKLSTKDVTAVKTEKQPEQNK